LPPLCRHEEVSSVGYFFFPAGFFLLLLTWDVFCVVRFDLTAMMLSFCFSFFLTFGISISPKAIL